MTVRHGLTKFFRGKHVDECLTSGVMASSSPRQRRSSAAAIIDAAEGMAAIFDIAGAMHPGNEQHPDPWIAARDDIADAWQETGELLGWAVNACPDRPDPIGSPPA